MFFYIEISNPLQSKPWFYKSDIALRLGWLWFCVGISKTSFHDLIDRANDREIVFERV